MDNIIKENSKWINETWQKIDEKLSKVALRSRDKLPYTAYNGIHDDKKIEDISWWTNGFWAGLMWLMYKQTGNEDYRKTAEHSECLLDEALKDYDSLHHDVGFMWHLSSGANYKITGNKNARTKNLFMASVLFSRYNVDGDYIRAWNGDCVGYSIIDCLMNIPLLYWASNEIGDNRFKKIAMRQMDMVINDHIREDGSIYHIVNHKSETKGVEEILAGQGYSENSCWSRGLAWAVYGSVLSYIHTKKKEYLEAAIKTAKYFINHVKETDYVPVIDFLAPKEPIYYDSTAGVCAACGMLEIAKCVDADEARFFTKEAINILKAIDLKCCDYNVNTDPLVLYGSVLYPHSDDLLNNVHIPIIYGDFFFVEAMMKLKKNDFLIW